MACVLFAILCISSYAQDSMGKYATENGYTVQKLARTSLYKVERNRLYGVVDSVGKVIVPVEYRKRYTAGGQLKNGEHVIYAENWKGYEGAFLSISFCYDDNRIHWRYFKNLQNVISMGKRIWYRVIFRC